MTQPPTTHVSWIDRFIGSIRDQLEDLTYVEIVTAAAVSPGIIIDPAAVHVIEELNRNNAGILARTRIELDGDILVILPSDPQGGAKIDKDVLAIHKENTAVAVENWKNFLNMMIALIDDITRLTGLTKDDLFKKFSIASP